MFAFAQRSAEIGQPQTRGQTRVRPGSDPGLRSGGCERSADSATFRPNANFRVDLFAETLRPAQQLPRGAHMTRHFRFAATLSLVYALASQVVSGASDATMFRGNVQHTGVYEAPGVPELH